MCGDCSWFSLFISFDTKQFQIWAKFELVLSSQEEFPLH